MNGIIGASIFLMIAFYFLYYLIESLVMGKWRKKAFKDNSVQIIIVLVLFVFAIVFYIGRHPSY